MPLQICPKCKRFHYVPGPCPEVASSPSGKAAAFDAATERSNRSGASKSAARKSAVKAQPAASRAPAIPAPAEPRIPVSTSVKSPKGRVATVHGDRPMTAKEQALMGHVIDAAADSLIKRRGAPIKANPKSKRAAYQRELMRKLRAKP